MKDACLPIQQPGMFNLAAEANTILLRFQCGSRPNRTPHGPSRAKCTCDSGASSVLYPLWMIASHGALTGSEPGHSSCLRELVRVS